MPFAVRVGLVIGAEMAEVVGALRRPCETVPTGIGERGDGPNLSYGMDDPSRSRPVIEGCRDLWSLFFRPKKLSIVAECKRRPPRASSSSSSAVLRALSSREWTVVGGRKETV